MTLPARLGALLGFAPGMLLAASLGGCATTALRPTSFGPMTCVPRTAAAQPPGRLPPAPASPEGKRQEMKPLLDFALCPAGQVPMLRAALPTVPKGNPLLGADNLRDAKPFFQPGAELGEAIRKGLRPWEQVYPHGPGRGGKSEAPPDPPGCNGVLSFGSCFYYGSAAYQRPADGGGMTMNIERPAFDGTNGAGH